MLEPPLDADADDACCLEITAPVDGVVLEVDVISARPVVPGTRLLSVGPPEELEIVADVLSSDAIRLAPGDRAIVERWGGDRPLEAEVVKIEPVGRTKISALGIEEQRVDVVLDLTAPRQERPPLGHGYAVFLRIVEWQDDAVLQVPISALFRDRGGWAVFVADNGTARLREVEIGRSNALAAQILGGLAEDERVIVHPSDRVEDGTPITPRREEG